MKLLPKFTFAFVMMLLIASCSKEVKDEQAFEDDHNAKFEESVVAIQDGYKSSLKLDLQEDALTIMLVCFDEDVELSLVYKIDGIEYCDNGLFNDEVANDGIYTSVETFDIDNTTKSITRDCYTISRSDNFKFNNELSNYLQAMNDDSCRTKGLTVKVGCKLRWATCPNSSWINRSFFGEDCIEYYDCEFSAEWAF